MTQDKIARTDITQRLIEAGVPPVAPDEQFFIEEGTDSINGHHFRLSMLRNGQLVTEDRRYTMSSLDRTQPFPHLDTWDEWLVAKSTAFAATFSTARLDERTDTRNRYAEAARESAHKWVTATPQDAPNPTTTPQDDTDASSRTILSRLRRPAPRDNRG